MTGFQLATIVLSVLGLLLTALNVVFGYWLNSLKSRLQKIDQNHSDLSKELERVHLKMVEEYVKDHDLKAVLERLDKTLDKTANNLEAMGKELQQLNTTVAILERANNTRTSA